MLRDFLPALRNRSLETGRPTGIMELMDEIRRDPFAHLPFRSGDFPAMDIKESDGEITVQAEMPGLEPDDVDISIENGVLSIKGEKKFEDEEKKDDYHRIERSYGSFRRQVRLPAEVNEDEAEASFDKGVLHITLPKLSESKAKKIEIKS